VGREWHQTCQRSPKASYDPRRRSQEAGCDLYLVKPADPTELQRLLQWWNEQRKVEALPLSEGKRLLTAENVLPSRDRPRSLFVCSALIRSPTITTDHFQAGTLPHPSREEYRSMSTPSEEQALVDLWRNGDEDAAREIAERYMERLLMLAQRRISQRLSSRVDAEDIVQSAYRTFFRRVKEGQFTFAEQDDLCKLLMRITLHKTLRRIAFHKAAKRDPSQETEQGEHHRERLLTLLDREPTPEAKCEFFDHLERFMSKLSPDERKVLELRLLGHSTEEIAKQLSTPERTWYDRKVRRALEHIRDIAEKEGLSPNGPTS
jgi:RNA polymerase sigma-70 factor (ECF subfamily)